MIMSAPARFMEVSISSTNLFSSANFADAASLTMEYSPLTLKAAIGTSNYSFALAIMSRYASAGLIMTISAPSSISRWISLSASFALAGILLLNPFFFFFTILTIILLFHDRLPHCRNINSTSFSGFPTLLSYHLCLFFLRFKAFQA